MKPTTRSKSAWKIKTTFFLLITLHSLSSYPQTWPKYYGEPNRHDYSRDNIETYDKGNLICGGYFNDDFSGAWLIKTDINGDTLWEKILDCEGYNYLNAIHQTMDGGLLACGAIQLNQSNQMPFIIKLNSCGEKVWCKAFASNIQDNAWAQDIKETCSGEIVVLVNWWGEAPEETMHLFKLNPDGGALWQRPYCSGYEHPEGIIPEGKSLYLTSQNECLIAGEVYWEDPWNPGGAKALRSLFVMVDSLGIEKWVLPYGLTDSIHGQGKNVYEIDKNRFIGIANKWPIENMQSVILEFDSLGNVVQDIIPDNESIDPDITRGVPQNFDKVDQFYALGGLYGNSDDIYSTEILLDTNIFIDFQVSNIIHHFDEDEPYTMAITNDGKIISNSTFKESGNWDISLSKLNLDLEYDTLYPGTYTYDSLCTEPNLPQSGFIFLDDCDIITGIDVPSPEEYYAHLQTIPISVYPNPTSDKVNFAMENTVHHNDIALKCFNLMGKQVFETTVATGQTERSTAVRGWPQGMYVAVVYSGGLPRGECKFVVQ